LASYSKYHCVPDAVHKIGCSINQSWATDSFL
jgi:hypothetical protein